MLDAKIAPVRNKIIQNSKFKKKGSFAEQKPSKRPVATRNTDRFHNPRLLLRVTGAHDSVLDYADLFSVTLHDDNIETFDTRWDAVSLSMSKVPSDDILERLKN